MTIQSLEIMKTAFAACVTWANQLFEAVDGGGVVLAAFCIVLVIGLLFIPMRGNAITNIAVYSQNKIHSGKKAKEREAQRAKNL